VENGNLGLYRAKQGRQEVKSSKTQNVGRNPKRGRGKRNSLHSKRESEALWGGGL